MIFKDDNASVPMETDKSADSGDEESDDDDDGGEDNGEDETPSDEKSCEGKKRKRSKDVSHLKNLASHFNLQKSFTTFRRLAFIIFL